MDYDEEYNFSQGRAGPIQILNLDDEVSTSNRDDRNGRGSGKRPPRGRDSSQSRDFGRGGRGRRGDTRGRGDNRGRGDSRGRGDTRGGGYRGRGETRGQGDYRGRRGDRGRGHSEHRGAGMPSGVSEQDGFDLRRYSSMSSLDSGPSQHEGHDNGNHLYNNEPRQRRSASRTRTDRIFGYRKLDELSKKANVDNVLMEILSESGGFQTLLKNTNMPIDWSRLLITVLGKACSSMKSHNKLQLVGLLVQENVMLLQVTSFLGKVQSRIVHLSSDQLLNLIQDICKIMKELMQRMPQEVHSITSALVMITAICQDTSFSLQHNEDTLRLINEISLTKDTIIKDLDNQMRERNMQPGGRRKHRDMESLPPPDNFKDLPILPNLRDLQFNEKPFLRRNKVDGCYDDLHHYLDVQFRLLREDYIQPLRNGITEYRRGKKDGKQKYQDIRLYHKVNIVRPICSNNGILHVIQFDVSKMKNMRWESSRRLLHGSLVCLSQNDFETIFFATVTNRDVKLLSQGLIEVQFKNNFQQVFEIKPSEEFIMAETTAYFEAYRHILRGLQEIEDGLPMQRYIVECKQALKPPKYLQNDIHYYDFSPLLHQNESSEECFPVINTRQWPRAEQLQLDTSQYRALQMALTKEMALIQGPPGTGKTFVGLKIMQLLLHNADVWRRSNDTDTDGEPNDSILVVCYTNHALDQFLEGVSEFCDSIVRIGGRCSNPTLEPFMLSNLRKEARINRQIPKLIWERKADCKKKMNLLKDEIENVSAKLDASRLGLMHEKSLELFIGSDHYKELNRGCPKGTDFSAIFHWLSSELHAINRYSRDSSALKTTVDEYSAYSKWLDYVINGPSFDLDTADMLEGNLWNKKLVERLCVYKQWVSSYIAYKQKCIDDVTEEIQALVEGNNKSDNKRLKHQQAQLESLRKDAQNAETYVMTEKNLKDGLRLELRQHLDRLIKTKPNASLRCSVVEHWLHLDKTFDPDGLFTEALEAIALVSETIDTLEEAEAAELERTIVDKDDEDDNQRSRTHEVLLSKAMSDLSYSFIGDANGTVTSKTDMDWQLVTSLKKTKEDMRKMLDQSQTMSEKEEAMQPVDVWTLSVEARFSLYKLWLSRYQDSLSSSIQDIVQQYSDICDVYQEVMDSEDVDIISGSRVIAMTTTGAAKYRNILRSVNPKIIVVEEAAEVLESHIVSTINSNCQHLILIGDHKQLRPTPTVYQLAIQYNLEISLFERMIKNQMNYVTLELQHRMRPEISNHMRLIYPDLRDHPSVHGMKNVLGIARNMYFIDHSFTETFHSETKSRSNTHEAEFIVALCKYLLQQGYLPTQVTVLTTYTGQVFALKKLMPKKEFEGVRVTAVDNYQGEENDIILLSLVRSNNDDSVGFLKTDNRVCVALSRAKMGFYVIGNFTLLCSQSILWTNIVASLKDNEAFGSYLMLRCQNHPEKTIKASLKSDFSKAPNGGCSTPCNTRLPCGHVCEQFCHITDSDHKLYRCLKQCTLTVCNNGHVCTRKCWQECGKCIKQVNKTIPYCGHSQLGPCHQDPHTLKCQSKCKGILPCGHKCDKICGNCKETNTHQLQCPELIQRKLICGHTIECKCFQRNIDISCTEKCTTELNCGHPCSGTCGGCFQGHLHMPCFERCNKMLICGHKCGQKCGEPCPPCEKKCSLRCEHSQCSLKCGQPCRNCAEHCKWECEHQRCTKLCYEVCDRLPCDMPCPKTLECGHTCSGLCDEICPQICFYCNRTKAKKIFKDATPATRYIVLEDCMHTFEKETLDIWMNADVLSSETFSNLEMKKCPTCSKPINKSKRYGNIIKQTRVLVNEVKQQLIGSKRKILTHCQQTKDSLLKLKPVDTESFDILMRKLEPVAQVTMASLEVINMQIKLLQSINDKVQTLEKINVTQFQRMGMLIKVSLLSLKKWVTETKYKPNKTEIRCRARQTFTPQELADVREEMLRLAYVAEVIRCAEQSHLSGISSLTTQYVEIHDILTDGRRMTQTMDERLVKIFKSLADRNPSCLPISEQRCIPKTMKDFAQKGRWLKCNKANHLLTGEMALGTECPRCMKAEAARKSKTTEQVPSKTLQQGPSQSRNSLQVAEKIIEQRKLDSDITSSQQYKLTSFSSLDTNEIACLTDHKSKYSLNSNSDAVQQTKARESSVYLENVPSITTSGEGKEYTEPPVPAPRRSKFKLPKSNDEMDYRTNSSTQTRSALADGIGTKSDAPSRISYSREYLMELRSSPLSQVPLPCLQNSDLTIVNTYQDKTEQKGEPVSTEDVQETSWMSSVSSEMVARRQNIHNTAELQWTEPKAVAPEAVMSSKGSIEYTKTFFTSQTKANQVDLTLEDATEEGMGEINERFSPSRLKWTEAKPLAPQSSKLPRQIASEFTKKYYTPQVDTETEGSMEGQLGVTKHVHDQHQARIRSGQYDSVRLQWTSPKPILSSPGEGNGEMKDSEESDKLENALSDELETLMKTSKREDISRETRKPAGRQWTDPKPVQKDEEITTVLEREATKTYLAAQSDNKQLSEYSVDPLPRQSDILFQCIEPGCSDIETPGCSGRCKRHYVNRELSLLTKIKNFIAK
ncbi:NFX1-type zinc finger-containing protein 1-like isoform X3 [Argopecten irradians]|uniref:NFX1-type zinc finger-containing protein 1-like isoform X3 n=1 Tax=Argopecten irradians TaxID=31199 RepID=UPI003711F683